MHKLRTAQVRVRKPVVRSTQALSSSLSIEYSRWQTSLKLISTAREGLNPKQAYEMKNIIESWLLSTHNGIETADEKLVHEMIEKRLVHKSDAEDLGKHLIQINQNSSIYSPCEVYVDNDYITCGVFNRPVNPRIKYLLDKTDSTQVMMMLLRYESLLPYGQHWGIPYNVTNYLYEIGFRNEGFASPLNSRFMDKEGGKFCSLFPETDKIFGSLGSFLDVNMEDYSGGWVINPPMIESLYDLVLGKIEQLLTKKKDTMILLCMSAWKDTKIYQCLRNSPYLVDMILLHPHKYYYETPEGEQVKANFQSVYFLLGNSLDKEVLDEIANRWLI